MEASLLGDAQVAAVELVFSGVYGACGLPFGGSLSRWPCECLRNFLIDVEARIPCLLRTVYICMFRISFRRWDRDLLCTAIDGRSNTVTVAGSTSKPVVSYDSTLLFLMWFCLRRL